MSSGWEFQTKMAEESDEFVSLSEATITDSEDYGFDQALRELKKEEDEEEKKWVARGQSKKDDEKRKDRAGSGGGSRNTATAVHTTPGQDPNQWSHK